AASDVHDFDDPAIVAALGAERHAELAEELALLDVATPAFDIDAFRRAELSPAFFGSALTNFGVEPFLASFLALAPGPVGRDAEGVAIEPEHPAFSGFVFKIQANMDPKHRDRIAFVRIVSGHFTAGMQVLNTRSGRDVRLAAPQQFMAQDRAHVEEAYAGDVVGIHDRGQLRIGDTLSTNGPLVFGDIPRFSPEHFARVSVPDPLRRKHLDTGLRQLSEEGAAQVFYEFGVTGPSPIIGAVGRLQFDVLLHRLEHEYNVKARLSDLPFVAARWVQGDDAAIRELVGGYGRALVQDSKGQPIVLFESEWSMQTAIAKVDGVAFFDVSP
ncbi:MAG: EF-Tu/IF-2/RF-3 family GTPase, partial [Longimicrobiales bacterium]